MELKDKIFQWIKSTLSVRQDYFANLPPCPYAADALLADRIVLIEKSSMNWKVEIENQLDDYDPEAKIVKVIAIQDWKDVDADELDQWCWEMRDKYSKKDIWILMDHPSIEEILGGQSMNFGSHLLLIVQSFSELVEASRALKSRGYYKNWPSTYMNDVVNRRNRLFSEIHGSKNMVP